MFRTRSNYRRMVHEKVDDFRKNFSFPLGTECTAIHIRRGDRTMDDVTGYCSHYRRFDKNGTCVNIDDPSKLCGVHQYDLGCFGEHPYGTLTLVDFLTRTAALNNIPLTPESVPPSPAGQPAGTEYAAAASSTTPVVFIMTDDAAKLEKEVALITDAASTSPFRHWRILTMGAKYDGHTLEHEQQHLHHETDAGVEFLASVALARTCHNYVSHFGSGLSVGIAHSLCYQHGISTTGKCPNMYDIGYAYDDDGHQLWLPPMTIFG
jgi:hypothetical protein